VVPVAPEPAIDIEKVLQTMVAMNQQTLRAVQEMNSQAMSVTIEHFTNITVEAVKEAMAALPIGSTVPLIEAPVNGVNESGTVSISEDEDTIGSSENDAPNSEKIAAILKTNPDLNGRQIAELAGCSERTARKWKGRIQVFTPLEN
jgi:hypothetical protein